MKADLKTYKFNFKATIGDFVLNAPNISCPLVVTWKRSNFNIIKVHRVQLLSQPK